VGKKIIILKCVLAFILGIFFTSSVAISLNKDGDVPAEYDAKYNILLFGVIGNTILNHDF
jgi:tetrahydromethanopterin S-methyltransferase subunit D